MYSLSFVHNFDICRKANFLNYICAVIYKHTGETQYLAVRFGEFCYFVSGSHKTQEVKLAGKIERNK